MACYLGSSGKAKQPRVGPIEARLPRVSLLVY